MNVYNKSNLSSGNIKLLKLAIKLTFYSNATFTTINKMPNVAEMYHYRGHWRWEIQVTTHVFISASQTLVQPDKTITATCGKMQHFLWRFAMLWDL